MADKKGSLSFELIEDFGEALKSYGGLPFVVVTREALGWGIWSSSMFE